MFHPSPRKAVRSLLRLARPPVPGFLDALSFSFIVCASNGHLLEARASSPLFTPPVSLLGQEFQLLPSGCTHCKAGVSDPAPGPAVLAAGFSWAWPSDLSVPGRLPARSSHPLLAQALGQGIATWHWAHLSGQRDSVPFWKECQDFRSILVNLGSRLSHPLTRWPQKSHFSSEHQLSCPVRRRCD